MFKYNSPKTRLTLNFMFTNLKKNYNVIEQIIN